VRQELFLERPSGACWLAWTLLAGEAARLHVHPFLSGRDYHALHRENGSFRFDTERCGAAQTFRPYDGLPSVTLAANGDYRHDPHWYRNCLYVIERERGLDDTEDLASPGVFSWTLGRGQNPAIMTLRVQPTCSLQSTSDVVHAFDTARHSELTRRTALGDALDRAADAYLVQRGSGRTLVAGYPWFTDWGRDTFIAVRGRCLARGWLAEAG
jgi:predicted glycogen debranching enzyme